MSNTNEKIRLNNLIKTEENAIKELYERLGQEIYKQYEYHPLPGTETLSKKITAARKQVARYKEAILDMDLEVRCSKCGVQVDKEAVFCYNCGAKITRSEPEKVCGQCGAKLPANSVFCFSCGWKVGE